MRMIVLEGTPEEIGKVMQTMEPMMTANVQVKESPQEVVSSRMLSKSADGSKIFVTVEFARRVLIRRPLSVPMKAVIKTLYEAHPEWVSSEDLYDASAYTAPQFAGLMGAFGRRMAYTEGFDPDAHFFDYQEVDDDDAGAWEYRLPDSVREALEAEGLV